MKKLIAILLALLCLVSVVSMVACGGNEEGPASDPVLDDIAQKFSDAMADDCEGSMIFCSEDGKTVYYEKSFLLNMEDGEDKDGNPLNTLEVPYFNYVGVSGGTVVMPDYMDGSIVADPEAKDYITLTELDFNLNYFKDNTYTYEKNKFSTVVTNASAFFATDIHAKDNTANITITMANNTPKKITIDYVTNLGYEVEIDIKFNY